MLSLACVATSACAPQPAVTPVPVPANVVPTPIEQPPAPDDPGALRVARFLGPQRVAALTRADRVETLRLKPWAGGAGVDGDFYGHRIIGAGPALSPAQIDDVRRLVFDAGSYVWESAKGCEFEPGVALRFYGGDPNLKPVDVLLCFSCDEWAFHNHGAEASEDFDPIRPALLALVKALFPDDPVIQGLK